MYLLTFAAFFKSIKTVRKYAAESKRTEDPKEKRIEALDTGLFEFTF